MSLKLDRRKALLVAERDFRDATGDLRLVLAMVGLAVLVPVLTGAGIRLLVAFGGGLSDLVERVSIVGAFFVVFLPASYSLVLALESFVGERERSTLEVLLSTPLREAEIYAGKVASVLAISLLLCFGGLVVYCAVTFAGLGYFPLGVLASLAVSTVCQVAAMVAGAVIVSANARTMRAANVMASFIILPMSIVLQVEAALILVGRGELLWGFALAMGVGAVILLRMGLAGFSREALLSRETGSANRLRRAWRVVAAAYRDAPSGMSMLRQRWAPIAISLAAFPIGAALGYLAAGAVPGGAIRPALDDMLTAGLGQDPLAFAVAIFLRHLLAIVLAGLFAGVTLGLTGYLLTGLPGALAGYAAAASAAGAVTGGFAPAAILDVFLAAVAGGLAINIGASVIHLRHEGGWFRRLVRAESELAKALLWIVPLLAVAALAEAYLGSRL